MAAEELASFAGENKLRNMMAIGKLLNEALPWQRVILDMVLQGGATAQAAFQAINDRLQELKPEQVCEQQEV